jgi:branched-chain amino acid transport system substrate-binding protein
MGFSQWIDRGRVCSRGLLVTLVLVLALGVAACGGDSEEPTTAAAPTTEAAPAESAPAETAPAETLPVESGAAATDTGAAPTEEQGISDYVAYTGGTAGPADSSLEPIKVGWVNNQGGSIAPVGESSTDAARFAVDYVNENLGGIGGHPLELVECFVKNAEEEGLSCGQQFLNDSDISVVNYGAVSVGANTINSTIAGKKPIVMAYSVNPSDVTNPNTFTLFGAGNFTVYGYGTFARDFMQAETAAILYPSVPGFTEIAAAVKESAEAAGVESTLVGFESGSSDLTGALTAAGAQDADVVVLIMAGADCVAMDRGIKQLGIDTEKVVAFLQCTDPSLREGYGGDFPQWKYGIAQGGDALENPPGPSGQAFIDALAQYGLEDKVTDPWYPPTFSQILTLAQFLNDIGPDNITPEAVSERLQSFSGPLLLGGPIIQCGKYPSAPAVCADGDYFFQYEGDGVFTRISDWIQTPIELQEELGAIPAS